MQPIKKFIENEQKKYPIELGTFIPTTSMLADAGYIQIKVADDKMAKAFNWVTHTVAKQNFYWFGSSCWFDNNEDAVMFKLMFN